MLELHKNKDFWAGIMLVGIGAGAIFFSRITLSEARCVWGPVLSDHSGWILVALGLCIIAVGFRRREKIQTALSLRALILLPSPYSYLAF